MTNKAHFKNFSRKHHSILPYSLTYSWWHEVVKNSWDVAVVLKNNQAVAIWPYFIRKKGPWQLISPPYFSPYAGPFIIYPKGQKQSSKVSHEHKMHTALIEQLPEVANIEQQCHLNFNNGLAFQWNGFEETINYTYILDLSTSEEVLWNNLRENTRRQIRKAEKNIQSYKKHDAPLVEQLHKATFKSKDNSYPIGDEKIIERITAYIKAHEKGSILFAKENEQLHTTNVCVYDATTAYYIIGGSLAEFRNSAGASLLMWEQILSAKKAGCRYFNFEGSSIKSIEKFLRGYGGQLHTVRKISKTNSKSLALLKKIKNA